MSGGWPWDKKRVAPAPAHSQTTSAPGKANTVAPAPLQLGDASRLVSRVQHVAADTRADIAARRDHEAMVEKRAVDWRSKYQARLCLKNGMQWTWTKVASSLSDR